MIPKAEAALRALEADRARAYLDGREPHVLIRELSHSKAQADDPARALGGAIPAPACPGMLQFAHDRRQSKLETPFAPAILARGAILYEDRRMTMTNNDISGGVVHEVPEDLRHTLASDAEALAAWEALTPLARNEWICWTISVKKPETRRQHVERVRTELKEGMRRPCCWYGCIHRTDKPVSPSVQYVLNKRSKKSS